jgi:hypothetical protein
LHDRNFRWVETRRPDPRCGRGGARFLGGL